MPSQNHLTPSIDVFVYYTQVRQQRALGVFYGVRRQQNY